MELKEIDSDLHLCMQGNFVCFLSSADFFSKTNFLMFLLLIRVSTSLDPDQAKHFVIISRLCSLHED